MEVLKISSKSNPNSCAGAIAGVLRHDGAVEVQVVGAGALNQAVKAVAIARSYVTSSGIDLVCVPSFADVEIEGNSRTAIRLLLEDRHGARAPSVDVRERAIGATTAAVAPAPPSPDLQAVVSPGAVV